MEKKRILYITQEMNPYLALSEIGQISRKLPAHAQNKDYEIRILMPRFGNINERRHRLHEVVRLSGINIIIGEDEYPLIIKVASIPGARMQVYFLDNDEFFQRRLVFRDKNEKFFEDNAERSIFFCKGALETVKRFGWAPDIVHCHGWMTSLVPLYLKKVYNTEPVFTNSKVIYSAYNTEASETLGNQFAEKALISENLSADDLKAYGSCDVQGLHAGAMSNSDAIIKGSAEFEKSTGDLIAKSKLPVMDYQEGEQDYDSYLEFYEQLLN